MMFSNDLNGFAAIFDAKVEIVLFTNSLPLASFVPNFVLASLNERFF